MKQQKPASAVTPKEISFALAVFRLLAPRAQALASERRAA